MKIREVRVRAVRVPLSPPHKTASGTVTESPLVLTDVETDEGVTGHSLIFTYTTAALKPAADLVRNIAPLIEGDELAPGAIEQKLRQRFRLLGTQGLIGMALSAIDMALWDALARVHRISLARLLGGVEKPIQAYGAVGYDGAFGSVASAEHWLRHGFKGIKVKIGYPTLKEDLEVLRAIRKSVGNDIAIMADYNQSLGPADAVERLRHIDDEGLTWIEEPVLAHDYSGHATVARAIRTPIQSGENWWGIQDLQHALDAEASDYVMFDVMKIGGVTAWMQGAALAAGRGVRVSNHLWPEISAQLLSVTPTAHWLEFAEWWNPIIAEPLRAEKGMAVCEGASGSGVAWDEAAVARYAA